MRGELREWRRRGGEGTKYRGRKREYKELCERKKKEENERWEKEAAEAKSENKVWEIVNKERKRKKKISEEIEIRDWKEYFMNLLGGVERRVIKGRSGSEEEG